MVSQGWWQTAVALNLGRRGSLEGLDRNLATVGTSAAERDRSLDYSSRAVNSGIRLSILEANRD